MSSCTFEGQTVAVRSHESSVRERHAKIQPTNILHPGDLLQPDVRVLSLSA